MPSQEETIIDFCLHKHKPNAKNDKKKQFVTVKMTIEYKDKETQARAWVHFRLERERITSKPKQ